MATLTLVVPKEFPATGPLRIVVSVPGFLLHHFDPELTETVEKHHLERLHNHPVTSRIAQLAANTCGRSDPIVEFRQAFMGHVSSEIWHLIVPLECSVPSTERDPPLVYLQANNDLDEDGNVELIPVVPRTAKARAKHHIFFVEHELVTDLETDRGQIPRQI